MTRLCKSYTVMQNCIIPSQFESMQSNQARVCKILSKEENQLIEAVCFKPKENDRLQNAQVTSHETHTPTDKQTDRQTDRQIDRSIFGF